MKDGLIKCKVCDWEWDIVTGGDDAFTCHKCGTYNKTFEGCMALSYNDFVSSINEGYYKRLDKGDIKDKKSQMKTQASKDDDDPSAYKDMPGDKEAKDNKEVKTSKHTKKYNELYEEQLLENKIKNASVEKALKKKSDETGVSIEIIREVMKRGMAAWKSGHRPGAGQEQWGYARINSFLTRAPGTWGRPKDNPKKTMEKGKAGADADLAQRVIKKGQHKGLKG